MVWPAAGPALNPTLKPCGCSSSSSCFFTWSIRSRIAALSACEAPNQSSTARRVMTRVCPQDTGNRSRIAKASSFEATQLLSGTSRNIDKRLDYPPDALAQKATLAGEEEIMPVGTVERAFEVARVLEITPWILTW